MNFSRPKTVAERYDVHPRTVMRWATDPRYAHLGFPKPVPMADNTTTFNNDELDTYDERRMALRDAELKGESEPKVLSEPTTPESESEAVAESGSEPEQAA